MRFSELGAIRFDRDLRSVTAYLGSQAEYGDMRERFQRLQQISTLLNLDEVCFLHPIVATSFLLRSLINVLIVLYIGGEPR